MSRDSSEGHRQDKRCKIWRVLMKVGTSWPRFHEIDNSRVDLSRALQLEPSNTSVKSELDSVDKARQHKSMVSS